MRLAWATLDYDAVIILSLPELLFFNFFLAFVSCLIGAQKFFEYSLYSRSRSALYIRNSIWTDHSGLIWYFLHIFGKLAIVWVFFGSITSSYLNFLEEYWWLFLLILLTLFFNQTNKYRLFFRNEARAWIPKIAVFYVSVSIILTLVTCPSSLYYNRLVNAYSIESVLDIRTPQSSVDRNEIARGLVFNIYYGFPKNGNAQFEAMAIGPRKFVDSTELSRQLIMKKQGVYFGQDILLNARIDKRIPFVNVNKLMYQLRALNLRKVFIATNEPSRGISFLLKPPCEELLKTDTIPVISCVEIKRLFEEDRAKRVEIHGPKIYVGGKHVSRQSFEDLARTILQSNPHTVFIITTDPRTTFGDFVGVLDAMFKANLALRDQAARSNFGVPYQYDDFYRSREIIEYMTEHHPLNIFIPSAAEARLIFD